jgi:anti-anti-sigma factor
MSIRVSKRNNNNDSVLVLEGRLDTSGSAILKLELDMATANPSGNIILDMGHVTFISSAGIGVTVKAQSILKQKGFEVRVAAANPEVKKIYDLLGFSHVVKLFPTLSDALKA